MEFDKTRCYSALNADELRAGDKVIVDYDVAHLKKQVICSDGIPCDEIKRINAEDITCRFYVGDGNDYPLAYLVERKENCTNCKYSNPHKNLLYCEDDNIPIYVGGEKLSVCDKYKPKTEQKAEKKCKDCGNAIDEEGKYCSGDEKHHWVDQTGEQKCWRPKAEQKAETPELISLGNGQYAEREKHYRPFRDTDELIKAWIAKRMVTYPDLCMPHIWVRNKSDSKVWLITEFDKRILDYLFPNCEFLDGTPCGVEE